MINPSADVGMRARIAIMCKKEISYFQKSNDQK